MSNKEFYILPFDHRNAFLELVADTSLEPDETARHKVARLKWLVYQGFLQAVAQGLPKTAGVVLADEEFSAAVLSDALSKKIPVCLGVEKHNVVEFALAYGDSWLEHVNKWRPAIVKALVKYNPADDLISKERQLVSLKKVADACAAQGYQFMLEPLVPATAEQLALCQGDVAIYERDLRPALSLKMIEEFYQASVRPDIWKVEGYQELEHYRSLLGLVNKLGGEDVSTIMLGRAQAWDKVAEQLRLAARAGLNGFAVGRTVFAEPLFNYIKDGNQTAAVAAIAQNFYLLYEIFKQARP